MFVDWWKWRSWNGKLNKTGRRGNNLSNGILKSARSSGVQDTHGRVVLRSPGSPPGHPSRREHGVPLQMKVDWQIRRWKNEEVSSGCFVFLTETNSEFTMLFGRYEDFFEWEDQRKGAQDLKTKEHRGKTCCENRRVKWLGKCIVRQYWEPTGYLWSHIWTKTIQHTSMSYFVFNCSGARMST